VNGVDDGVSTRRWRRWRHSFGCLEATAELVECWEVFFIVMRLDQTLSG